MGMRESRNNAHVRIIQALHAPAASAADCLLLALVL